MYAGICKSPILKNRGDFQVASKKQKALKIAKRFVSYVNTHYKKINRAFLFGSYSTGKSHRGSDIDIALVSPFFSKDAYDDQIELMKLKTHIDFDIEPHPFHTSMFRDENPIVWEIKQHGIAVK